MPKFLALRTSLLVVIGLLLSGCIVSQQPKFPLSSAVSVLGDGGRYAMYECEGASWKREEVFTVKHRPDGAYDFVNEKGETFMVSFHALAENEFIGQSKPEKSRESYGYAVLRTSGNEALLLVPQCDKQDKAKLRALAVEFPEQYECRIDKVADPTALFRTLNLGPGGSKLVRE